LGISGSRKRAGFDLCFDTRGSEVRSLRPGQIDALTGLREFRLYGAKRHMRRSYSLALGERKDYFIFGCSIPNRASDRPGANRTI